MITILVWSYIFHDKFNHLDRCSLYICDQEISEYVLGKIYSYFICNYTEWLVHHTNSWDDIENEQYFW